MPHKRIAVIGAGPAGLTAAYELAKHGMTGTIFETDSVVGGISRTEERAGYRFDIGGHRFFSKSKEITDLWDEILPGSMLLRPRLSRIFYGGKFYDYPLKPMNALGNMGIAEALSCLGSYGMAKLRPIPDPGNFEQWVTNEFGSRLYRMFFKAYTEKLWGIPCTEIGADWAAQRIKGLSLGEVVRNAVVGAKNGKVVKSLIDEFKYPRLGPGQLWESCADSVKNSGWALHLQTQVVGIAIERGMVNGVTVKAPDGETVTMPCDTMLSSMPVRELINCITPRPPDDVLSSANQLKYRDFVTVSLVLDVESAFPDNWIYIHAPEVTLGRIQNYKNWSPDMVPDPSRTCLGLEYFVNEGDSIWSSPDEELVNFGYKELSRIGLAKGKLLGGHVVRMPKAYPVYDTGYQERLDILRTWLASIKGLYCVGRNGQHRYNNMDHSMMTALIAARNIAFDESRDPWAVNEDAEYHEKAA